MRTLERYIFERIVVDEVTGCHLWTRAKDRAGYGKFVADGVNWLAHRAAWFARHGELPAGLHVCHKCDTPACCNPEHLFLGTDSDNRRDAQLKGRLPRLRGERHGRAVLTNEQATLIRAAPGLHREIAADYGVSRPTVTRIKAGATYP